MKRRAELRMILGGLTQEEMASLLGVSRSLWSLYELGKRQLPFKASQRLAELLIFRQASRPARLDAKKHNPVLKKFLEKALQGIQLRRMRYEQRTTKKTDKSDQDLIRHQLRDFMDSATKKGSVFPEKFLLLDRPYAEEKNQQTMLVDGIKLELFELIENFYREKLKSLEGG